MGHEYQDDRRHEQLLNRPDTHLSRKATDASTRSRTSFDDDVAAGTLYRATATTSAMDKECPSMTADELLPRLSFSICEYVAKGWLCHSRDEFVMRL